MSSPINNIVIAGGSGSLGSIIVDNIVTAKKFTLSAITRPSSKSKFPDSVQLKKGEYDDTKFLKEALTGQDALIIALGPSAPLKIQTDLVNAAAEAGVPWILANHWSSDGANEKLNEKIPLLQEKDKPKKQIEDLGKSNWLALANNQFTDWNLVEGTFGIDIPKRTAVLFDQGTTKIYSTTMAQVGRATAAILGLPEGSLKAYKNGYVYIKSFELSQRDMLDSIQRVTKTTDKDWSISYKPVDKHIEEGWKGKEEEAEDADFKILFGNTFKEGMGDKFYGRELANQQLGLPQEDLDEVMREIVKSAKEKEQKEMEEKEKEKKEKKKDDK